VSKAGERGKEPRLSQLVNGDAPVFADRRHQAWSRVSSYAPVSASIGSFHSAERLAGRSGARRSVHQGAAFRTGGFRRFTPSRFWRVVTAEHFDFASEAWLR
jgi:hypothetical protein